MSQSINPPRNKAKITIQQGSDFSLTFDLSQFTADLTDATGRGQIRSTASSSTVLASFVCSVDSVEKEMVATITAADSSAISLPASDGPAREIATYAYDIELVFDDGVVARLLWGEVDIVPEVTRS